MFAGFGVAGFEGADEGHGCEWGWLVVRALGLAEG